METSWLEFLNLWNFATVSLKQSNPPSDHTGIEYCQLNYRKAPSPGSYKPFHRAPREVVPGPVQIRRDGPAKTSVYVPCFESHHSVHTVYPTQKKTQLRPSSLHRTGVPAKCYSSRFPNTSGSSSWTRTLTNCWMSTALRIRIASRAIFWQSSIES